MINRMRNLFVAAMACSSLTLTTGCGEIEWASDGLAGEGVYQPADEIVADEAQPEAAAVDCGDDRADTAPLADDAVSGPWGPMSRVTRMGVPQSPEEGAAIGCQMIGHNNGSGLATFLAESDLSIDELLAPGADGQADLVLLAALEGWTAGETGNGAGRTDLNLVMGQQDADGNLLIDPISLSDAGQALDRFPNTRTECGEVDTDPSDIIARLPILGGVNIPVSGAALNADLTLDAEGFTMTGRLQGYLTRDTLVDLLYFVLDHCAQGSDQPFCEPVAGIPATDAIARAMTPVFAGQYLGGFDAVIDAEGNLSDDCEPGVDCNAVSVCLTLESAGQAVAGVGR